jgi:hypothetical protein
LLHGIADTVPLIKHALAQVDLNIMFFNSKVEPQRNYNIKVGTSNRWVIVAIFCGAVVVIVVIIVVSFGVIVAVAGIVIFSSINSKSTPPTPSTGPCILLRWRCLANNGSDGLQSLVLAPPLLPVD